MEKEFTSDEELDEIIRWCRSVAYGSCTDKTKVTNEPWYRKYLFLLELRERRNEP